MILPGETKTFTFFFKSENAGIFREFWEFVTHPTLLGGAVLQVNLHAVSLAQDIYRDDRILLEVRKGARTWAPCGYQRGRSGILPGPCLQGSCFSRLSRLPGLYEVRGGWAPPCLAPTARKRGGWVFRGST